MLKVLTLWQPWASAVVRGSKRMETRSWPTSYRGPLLIHAAKRCPSNEILGLGSSWTWCGVLGWTMGNADPFALPFGAIVGMVEVTCCVPTTACTVGQIDAVRGPDKDGYGFTERNLGDFTPGRWAWGLANAIAFENPVECRGKQRIWNVELHSLVGEMIREALREACGKVTTGRGNALERKSKTKVEEGGGSKE